jgi:hypothetical protein
MAKYQRHAADCLLFADQCGHPALRLGLLDMAHSWLQLAEQAQKNYSADLVCEVPSTSPKTGRYPPHGRLIRRRVVIAQSPQGQGIEAKTQGILMSSPKVRFGSALC